ncbi:hypothetical protein Taro_011727 [Colocasia esculenta]|uniref:Uncharacterized protein n=1 Tax=Colocasia esculenta TaxID=4460 RepID=A0A843UAX8_COLES|nr:hypothetical protein [Colocasia esculenta]
MMAERAQMRGMQQTIQELTRAIVQATQGGGNCGAGDLHRNFRSLNPPRFSGSMDPDEDEHWLQEMERIFRIMQCAAGDKLLLAMFQLEKDARAWWESVEATRENGPFTWNEPCERDGPIGRIHKGRRDSALCRDLILTGLSSRSAARPDYACRDLNKHSSRSQLTPIRSIPFSCNCLAFRYSASGRDKFSHPLPRNLVGRFVISAMKAMKMVNKGCDAFLASVVLVPKVDQSPTVVSLTRGVVKQQPIQERRSPAEPSPRLSIHSQLQRSPVGPGARALKPKRHPHVFFLVSRSFSLLMSIGGWREDLHRSLSILVEILGLMESNKGLMPEGHSVSRPPFFDGTDYSYWKNRMQVFLRAQNFELWKIVNKGAYTLPEDEDTWTKDQIAKGTLNWSALNMVQCAVHPNEYSRVSICSSAKEMWDKLELIYEECPELKKKLKKEKFTLKKAKAMLATWSDEDEDEDAQATSRDEEIQCLMARSDDSNEPYVQQLFQPLTVIIHVGLKGRQLS